MDEAALSGAKHIRYMLNTYIQQCSTHGCIDLTFCVYPCPGKKRVPGLTYRQLFGIALALAAAAAAAWLLLWQRNPQGARQHPRFHARESRLQRSEPIAVSTYFTSSPSPLLVFANPKIKTSSVFKARDILTHAISNNVE